jgi:hypothetical protein
MGMIIRFKEFGRIICCESYAPIDILELEGLKIAG